MQQSSIHLILVSNYGVLFDFLDLVVDRILDGIITNAGYLRCSYCRV